MTFLNPLVLFGLIAAVIPLIIHLLNLRKLRTIEFSTLFFLKELQQTKIRRLKLKQLLLLLIRTLMVIFIVLAFSRPAMKSSFIGTVGTHAYSTVVLILDDSFSMTVQDNQGELFKQARESGLEVVELLKEGDEAFLIKLSDPESEQIIPRFDFEILETVIRESKVSLVSNSVEDGLRLAAKIINNSSNANKEVYLLSDFQKSGMLTMENKTISETANLFGDNVKFYFINFGEKEFSNAAVDSVKIETRILEKDKPLIIDAVIKNYTDTDKKDFVTGLFLDEIRVAQKSADVLSWGRAAVSLTAHPKTTGLIKGYIQLENDIIEIDNKRFFTMNIPEKIKVGIISDSEENVKFIKAALRTGYTESDGSVVAVTDMNYNTLSSSDFKNFDVLLLAGNKEISSFEFSKIRSFVEFGGGLIIFPASEDINQVNRLFSGFEIPQAEKVNKTSREEGISIQKIDYAHPIFHGVFEANHKSGSEIEPPQIYISLKRGTGKKGLPVITMSDGSSFLSEYSFGDGKILVFASAANLTWSDFPVKGLFAPLIYRSIVYSGQTKEKMESFLVGQSINLNLKGIPSKTQSYKLLYPDLTEELIPIISDVKVQNNPESKYFYSPTSNLILGRLYQQGIYTVKDGEVTINLFSMNTDPRESDLRKIDSDRMEKFLSYIGINSKLVVNIKSGDNISEKILETRLGVELWKYAIGLVLLLALLEMILAGNRKKDEIR